MKKGYLPYIIPLDDYFQVSFKVNGRNLPDDGILKEWQPSGFLKIDAELKIDSIFKLSEFIQPDASAVFVVSWYSDAGMDGNLLRGRITAEDVSSDNLEYRLTGVIDNTLISGAVTVDISLAVADPGRKTDPLKADRRGLLLWSREFNIIVEGAVSYFPAADASFKDNGLPHDALFHLQRASDDYSLPFSSNYQLILNNKHPMFKIINEPGGGENERWIKSFFEYSVYRNIIEDVVCSEDFHEWLQDGDENSEGKRSTGGVYNYLIETIFGKNCTLDDLKNRYRNEKSRFEMDIQSIFLRCE